MTSLSVHTTTGGRDVYSFGTDRKGVLVGATELARAEQVAYALREVEGGRPVADVCRQMGADTP